MAEIINKDEFLDFVEKKYNGFESDCFRQTIENLVDFALDRFSGTKDEICYFLSDVLPEVEFGEVAVFIGDEQLTRYGLAMKNEFQERMMSDKEIVGTITYHYSGECVEYTDKNKLIEDFKDALDTYGPNGVEAEVVSDNLELRYEIDKAIYGAFGEELAPFVEWMEGKREIIRENDGNEYDPPEGIPTLEIPDSKVFFPVYYGDGCVIEPFSVTFEDALELYKNQGDNGARIAISKLIGDDWVEVPLLMKKNGRDRHLDIEGNTDPEIELASLKAKKVIYPFDEVTRKRIDILEKEMGVYERGVDMTNDLFVGNWRVHLVPTGGRYGLDNDLVNKKEETLIEFYDFSVDKESFPHGQYVARYSVRGLLEDEQNLGRLYSHYGLCLDADVDSWNITGTEMCQVFRWLEDQPLKECDKAKTALDRKIEEAERSGASQLRVDNGKLTIKEVFRGNEKQLE